MSICASSSCDGVVALGEQLQDADARGVPERAEELGLGLVQRDGHGMPHACVGSQTLSDEETFKSAH